MSDRLTRLSAPLAYALLLGLGLLLFLPRLGTFGFWDPYEIHVADAARKLLEGAAPWSLAAPPLGRPPAVVALVAVGFKWFGMGELGGRLPIALTSVLALLACFYAGSALIRRRGALLGSLILATTPVVLLGARQVTTNAPLLLATALAVGGLARLVLPTESTPPVRRLFDGLLALLGLALGQLTAGVLIGVIAPLATIAIALAASAPSGSRTLWALFTGGAAAVLLAIAAWVWGHPSPYSTLIGGVPHALSHEVVFTSMLKQLGFGLFPWVALLPMAAIHALVPTTSEAPPTGRDWFGHVTLVTWFVVLYCAATLQAAAAKELLLPAGPPVLLLIGAYLDDLLESREGLPFAGLTIGLGVLVIGRDFFVEPTAYLGAHLLDTLRWPGPLPSVPYLMIGYAVLVGSALGIAAGVSCRRLRGWLIAGAISLCAIMALLTAHYLVPQCSRHLSSKELYGKTKKLDPQAPIGHYRFSASGSSFYTGGRTPVTLGSLAELFQFLGRTERVFVMAGASELAPIDQYAKEHHLSYRVIDNSSARSLMLSNRLGNGERDENPLLRFVTATAPSAIQHPLHVNFEDKVELIGWDAPSSVGSRQDWKLRLYFRVMAPLPASYKIFVHIENGSTRVNGDHPPLEGKFPTAYWVPGTFITDEHTIEPSLNNTGGAPPNGYYQVYMGFYSGLQRLKITSGPSDSDNRAKLGGITIR